MDEELCEARWGWSEEFDSDSARDSDNDTRPGVQNKPAKREACDENQRAMELDANQAELEEETRFAASFQTTCVRSMEHCKLADAVPSEKGRPTKGKIQKGD